MTKKCTKCKIEKPLEDFYNKSRTFKNPRVNNYGKSTICKKCTSEKVKLNRIKNQKYYTALNKKWEIKNPERRKEISKKFSHSPKGIYASLFKRGRERVKISQDDFINWYLKEEKKCFYCGLPEEYLFINLPIFSKGKLNRRLTIDKTNPLGSYEIGNIVLACGICNLMKSNVLTKEEMLEVGKIINSKWNKLYEISRGGDAKTPR